MRLNVIAISIEDPTEHVVGAVLSELLNLTFGDGQLSQPEGLEASGHQGIERATQHAGEGTPSSSLAAAGGDTGAGASTPPPRPAALRLASGGTGNPIAVRAVELDDQQRAALVKAVNGRRRPGAARHLDEVVGAAGAGNPTTRKPGMLATEEERKHFRNVHGGKATEPRVVNSGQVKEALRTMRPGDELVVSPPPRKTNSIQKMINEMRRAGALHPRVCVEQDHETKTVRIAWYEEDDPSAKT